MKFFKWIFKRPKAPVIESSPLAIKIKKIAIIVGHGNGDPGAMGWNGTAEHTYNTLVAEMIGQSITNKEIRTFYRGPTGILGVAAKAVAWMPDLTLEMHLNAFNGKAMGCEVLCLKGDLASGVIGKSFAKKLTTKFNRKLRGDSGIKWLENGDRGATSLRAVSAVKHSILIESFFIDNKDEWIEPMTYANFLIEWINEL